MREIKFRVWTGSAMEYNITVGKFGAFFVSPGRKGDGLDEKDTASLTPFNTRYSKETPVMQYTGLKDKNGKEIYEGDILRFIEQDTSDGDLFHVEQEVKWGDQGWTPSMLYEGEIIGNVHENPELLSPNN